MKQNTFNVLFLVRKTRLSKTGEAPIHMRITVNGRFMEINTQRRIEPSSWNQKKERAVGKSPATQEINRYLEGFRTKAYELQKRLMDQNGYVDPIVIKEHLQGKHQNFKMFFQVFQEQIMHKEKLKGIDYCDKFQSKALYYRVQLLSKTYQL